MQGYDGSLSRGHGDRGGVVAARVERVAVYPLAQHYRFSEDLDFTITDDEHMDQDFLNDTFVEIADWIYDRTGLELPPELHTFEIYANPRGRTSCQGKLSYRGPIAPRSGGLPRIKLDLTADEHVALAPIPVPIFHAVVERAGSAAFTISDLLQRPNTLIRARRLSPQQESVFLFFKLFLVCHFAQDGCRPICPRAEPGQSCAFGNIGECVCQFAISV